MFNTFDWQKEIFLKDMTCLESKLKILKNKIWYCKPNEKNIGHFISISSLIALNNRDGETND